MPQSNSLIHGRGQEEIVLAPTEIQYIGSVAHILMKRFTHEYWRIQLQAPPLVIFRSIANSNSFLEGFVLSSFFWSANDGPYTDNHILTPGGQIFSIPTE